MAVKYMQCGSSPTEAHSMRGHEGQICNIGC